MKHDSSHESSKYQVLFEKGNLYLESWDKGAVFLMKRMSNGMAYNLGEYWNFEDAKVALEDYAGGDNYYCQKDYYEDDENFGDECYVTNYYRGEYE
jgi:hypothetical protein